MARKVARGLANSGPTVRTRAGTIERNRLASLDALGVMASIGANANSDNGWNAIAKPSVQPHRLQRLSKAARMAQIVNATAKTSSGCQSQTTTSQRAIISP